MSRQQTPDPVEPLEPGASAPQHMRAMQFARFGGAEVLAEVEAAVPTLPAGCVLVRVAATSVNPVDILARRGLLRLGTGFALPRGTGMDYAGEVVGMAPDVSSTFVGERVWGFLGVPRGATAAAAEFVIARVGTYSAAPLDRDLVTAAALPLAGSTALVALRDHLKLSSGDRLLVRGGAGGIASTAIQLAHALGAHVTALVSSRDLAFARELGADAALDYRTHGPEQLGEFDAILDVTGTALFGYQKLLSPGGRLVSTAAMGYAYVLPSVIFGSRRIRAFAVKPTTAVLAALSGFVNRGELSPVVDTVWPLADLGAAHRALEVGGTRGKQVVSLSTAFREESPSRR